MFCMTLFDQRNQNATNTVEASTNKQPNKEICSFCDTPATNTTPHNAISDNSHVLALTRSLKKKYPASTTITGSKPNIAAALAAEFGQEQVDLAAPLMGSEDFGALGDAIGVPNVFWMFGGADPADPSPAGNHSPFFLPEYRGALDTGVRAALAGIRHYVGR